MSEPSYRILDHGYAIQCLHCGLISHHPEDVTHRYCGKCHRFHERLPPEAPVCYWCKEPVLPHEARAPIPHQIAHWECGLRAVVGGLNHLNGQCSCCGGTLPPDPEGVSRREAARMAAQAWRARNHP